MEDYKRLEMEVVEFEVDDVLAVADSRENPDALYNDDQQT